MIRTLFRLYRTSPFWLREVISRSTWPIRVAMTPFRTMRIAGYQMTLDFADNASFKYYSDRERYELSETTAFVGSIIHNPGACVIDVGANYGAFTLAAAQLARFNVLEKILAIEPDRRPIEALRDSIERNGFGPWVLPMQVILGDRDGEETLFVNARSSADNRSHKVTSAPVRVRDSYTVRSARLDTLLPELNISADRFIIKMDIQGNEGRAFAGMLETLKRAAGYIVMFEDCPYLVESAGVDREEYLGTLRELKPEQIFEIEPERLVPLADFDRFVASIRQLEERPETRMQGAGSNYLFARGMSLEGLSWSR